jgi:hypothetical protein
MIPSQISLNRGIFNNCRQMQRIHRLLYETSRAKRESSYSMGPRPVSRQDNEPGSSVNRTQLFKHGETTLHSSLFVKAEVENDYLGAR